MLEDAQVIDVHLRNVVVALQVDFPSAGSANGIIDEQNMRLPVGVTVGGMAPYLFIVEIIGGLQAVNL